MPTAPASGGTPLTTNPNGAFTQLTGGAVVQSNSPTKVYFTVTGANGNPIEGLTLNGVAGGNCGTYNIRAAIAKLRKSGTSAPDTWQNLITLIRPVATNPNGFKEGTTDPAPTATPAAGQGSLTYANGVYTYTFGTDITDAAYSSTTAAPSSGTITTDGNALVKDATTTYRVGLQICYVDSNGKTVNVNPWYDFTMGSDGLSVHASDAQTKKVVDRVACNGCHGALNMHGGRRVDPNYCVLCHNPGSVDYHNNGLTTLGPVCGNGTGGNQGTLDCATSGGGAQINLPYMIHKYHRGELLTKDYKVHNAVARHDTLAPIYDNTGTQIGTIVEGTQYPQDQRNCTTCHDNAVATNANNWKHRPSRAACGACHDGINWVDGTGTTIDPDVAWHSLGHLGGAQANDNNCVLCHDGDGTGNSISNVYHSPVVPQVSSSRTTYYASGQDATRLPTGTITVSYDIKSVTVDASRHAVVTFCMKQNGVCTPLNNPGTGTPTGSLWNNFTGSPSIYVAYSVTQDGTASPSDFNAFVSNSVLNFRNGSGGTLSGPDASNYYTATFTGATSQLPASVTSSNLVTAALGYGAMYQINVAGYEGTNAQATGSCSPTPCTNGFNVAAQDVKMAATGYVARRSVVDVDKCNNCHERLGIFAETTFHSGQRNDPTMCAMCHNPNRTSSGWSADSTAFVHGIHAGQKRTVPYVWHATTGCGDAGCIVPVRTKDFHTILFPGGVNHLGDCKTCHVAGGYDFTVAPAQTGNRLYKTAASGTMAAAGTSGALSLSPYVTAGTTYGTTYTYNTAAPSGTESTSLVNSPIANACFSCHDGNMTASPSTSMKDHIELMGIGSLYRERGTPGTTDTTKALARAEQCLLCHASNSNIAPIAAAHGQ